MREGESGVYEGLLGVECDVLLWGGSASISRKKAYEFEKWWECFFLTHLSAVK